MINPTQIIPTRNSSSQSWIQWHKAMKSRYGKKQANFLFVKGWDNRAGAGTNASTNELREYMKQNGVTLDSTTLESVTDSVSSGLDSIGDMFTVGKYLIIGTSVIIVGGLGLLIYNIAKQPIKAASTAASFTPVGRATKFIS